MEKSAEVVNFELGSVTKFVNSKLPKQKYKKYNYHH